jgi:alanine-glyoxylate transaminase/(R)-3-amino-2-methylpropionate-pyruvate transaminase
MIVEGKAQYLFDNNGRRYLDCIGGIVTVSVGHCHPEVTKAAIEQQETIVHTTTIYLNPQVALFAKELAAKMPGDLKVCYFVNSGSEANDLAITMARAATGNYDVIALRNAYHGGSQATIGLTAVGTWKFPLPVVNNVKHVAPGYCYRCPFGLTYPSCDVIPMYSPITPARVFTPDSMAVIVPAESGTWKSVL